LNSLQTNRDIFRGVTPLEALLYFKLCLNEYQGWAAQLKSKNHINILSWVTRILQYLIMCDVDSREVDLEYFKI